MSWAAIAIGAGTAVAGVAGQALAPRPQNVDPAQVGADSLAAQLRLAPQQFMSEAQLRPLYQQLNMNLLGQSLLGQNPQQQAVWERFPNLQQSYEEYVQGVSTPGAPGYEATPRSREQWLADHLAENPNDPQTQEIMSYQAGGTPMSMLDILGAAGPQYQDLQNRLNTSQRQAGLDDVTRLGPQLNEATRAANPQLTGMLDALGADAQASLGSGAPFHNAILDNYSGQAQAAQVGQARDVRPAVIQAAQQGPAAQARAQGTGPATQAQASAIGPVRDVAGTGMQGSQLLGGLNSQAQQAMSLSPIGQELQSQAMGDLALGGQLNAAQSRNLAEASRSAFGSRGLGQSQAGAIDEAIRAMDLGTQLQNQRRAFAGGVDAQNQGLLNAGRNFGLGVEGANQNLGQFNANLGQQAGMANQQSDLARSLTGAQMGTNVSLANAGAANQLQGLNAQLGTNVSLANAVAQNAQGANNAGLMQQANLANQGALQNAGFANQASDLQRLGQQAGYDQTANMANFAQGADQSRYNAGLQNQTGMFNVNAYLQNREANRAYAGNTANLLAGTRTDPLLAILGQQSAAPGASQQLAGGAAGFGQSGPQLFNPFSSDILGIFAGNAANQTQAGIAQGNMYGDILGSGLGALGQYYAAREARRAGGACWVARRAYGEANPKWMQWRQWLMTHADRRLQNYYMECGETIATKIDDETAGLFRHLFDAIMTQHRLLHGGAVEHGEREEGKRLKEE